MHSPDDTPRTGPDPRVEVDDPPSRSLTAWVFGMLLLVVLTAVGVRTLALQAWRARERAVRLEPVNDQLTKLRKAHRTILTTFAAKDETTGKRRIPVDLALDLMAKDPKLLLPLIEAPVVPARPSASPAPTSGQIAPTGAAATGGAPANAPDGVHPSAPTPAPAGGSK
ncbi:MAG: hypothetical protein D6729_01615 [Deltaproteobacteria bacterium]|nr:MAG: hypothetical protein D6729_01615 [Deltaproteobacteria bacterium]